MLKHNSPDTVMTYTVSQVAYMLQISLRSAYYLCNGTKDFKVLRLGRSIRIVKSSFDEWFDRQRNMEVI